MTVKDLIAWLQTKNQDTLVHTMAHDDDIALIVTDVREDVLAGKEKAVVLIY